jgi:hypothetical protein
VGFRSRSALGHAFEVLIYLKRESPKEVKIGIRFTILTASFLFPEATNETIMMLMLGGGTVLAVSTAIVSGAFLKTTETSTENRSVVAVSIIGVCPGSPNCLLQNSRMRAESGWACFEAVRSSPEGWSLCASSVSP